MTVPHIANNNHYNLTRVASVRKSLRIGTADIKDHYVNVSTGPKQENRMSPTCYV